MGLEVVISIQKREKMAPSNWDEFNDMPCVWWSGGSSEMAKAICRSFNYTQIEFIRLDMKLMDAIKDDLRDEKAEHVKAIELCDKMARYASNDCDRLDWVKDMMEHKDVIADINFSLKEIEFFKRLIDNENELYVGVSY